MKRQPNQGKGWSAAFLLLGLLFFAMGAGGVGGLIELWARDYRDDMGPFGKIVFSAVIGGASLLGFLLGLGMVRIGLFQEKPTAISQIPSQDEKPK